MSRRVKDPIQKDRQVRKPADPWICGRQLQDSGWEDPKCRRKDPVPDQWEEGQPNPLEKQEDQQGGRQYQERRDSGNG